MTGRIVVAALTAAARLDRFGSDGEETFARQASGIRWPHWTGSAFFCTMRHMTTFKDLKDTLTAINDKFETKKSMIFFSSLHYKATGEKVVEGFRYFACGIDDVLAAVVARDFNALSALPFALDEDGDPDTSAVLVDLAYTESGAFVAVQPVEYQDHRPTPVADVFLLEGNDAKTLFPTIKKLDQSA